MLQSGQEVLSGRQRDLSQKQCVPPHPTPFGGGGGGGGGGT